MSPQISVILATLSVIAQDTVRGGQRLDDKDGPGAVNKERDNRERRASERRQRGEREETNGGGGASQAGAK
jgi:hypothetical protein